MWIWDLIYIFQQFSTYFNLSQRLSIFNPFWSRPSPPVCSAGSCMADECGRSRSRSPRQGGECEQISLKENIKNNKLAETCYPQNFANIILKMCKMWLEGIEDQHLISKSLRCFSANRTLQSEKQTFDMYEKNHQGMRVASSWMPGAECCFFFLGGVVTMVTVMLCEWKHQRKKLSGLSIVDDLVCSW